jgi:hypothetical protein
VSTCYSIYERVLDARITRTHSLLYSSPYPLPLSFKSFLLNSGTTTLVMTSCQWRHHHHHSFYEQWRNKGLSGLWSEARSLGDKHADGPRHIRGQWGGGVADGVEGTGVPCVVVVTSRGRITLIEFCAPFSSNSGQKYHTTLFCHS